MKTFYVVAIGNYYSDYRVIAITDNKERAENIKNLYSDAHREPYIEEFTDSGTKDDLCWTVTKDRNGTYFACQTVFWNDINNIIVQSDECPNEFFVSVFAKSKDYAIKIAQDLWAEYKAKKEGIV